MIRFFKSGCLWEYLIYLQSFPVERLKDKEATISILIDAASKHCNKCKEKKPVSCFGYYKKSSDGLRSHCKDCRKIESKQQLPNQNKRRSHRWHNDEDYRAKESKRHKKYNPKANERERNKIAEFSDNYVIKAIKRGTDLTTEDIKEYPMLIEVQREHMKLNRKLKHGN